MLRDLTIDRVVPRFDKWVNKLCDKLFNDDGDIEKHKLNRQQMQVLKSLQENKYNIIKGLRRCGLSTMLMLNTLYNLLYKEVEGGYRALFIYDRKMSAEYARTKFLELLKVCDEYVCMTKNVSGEIELLFDGRKIIVEFVSQYDIKDWRGRNEKISDINIDNAAWVEDKNNSDSIAELSKQTNANVSIASIPNGTKNLFYETWHDSMTGTAPFKMSSMKWYLDDRFNKNLKAGDGLQSYNVDNMGMLCEALEKRDMITNEWYEKKKVLLGSSVSREIDGDFD